MTKRVMKGKIRVEAVIILTLVHSSVRGKFYCGIVDFQLSLPDGQVESLEKKQKIVVHV